ncbi:MAG: ribulose-phosphate 3-epimerase [Chloroflexi bacterium]|jgi:ribulose-phosphate 3-epimerase|nr:ribulose-phosphate 3-epimerase [Chloroflexota bacterium]MBT3670706.1 ribulose-phosphate 3-epimerase [Chloroflexota bacterium]MBT4002635.1 ribulose-phosphate 3-epimerase [Chloroflexota bacterium]MBT4306258.1 ribulose-phosphate 3-epimerase [Chloroflexota bacterium]MBT4532861.1 ribulose-phosphate 3-epimerase [Chloroflexota bacterium]
MANQNLIAPSILSADFTQLGNQLKEIEDHGADWVHIDVIDGQFAPNITMGIVVVEACKRVTNLPLNVHLMINNPENLIADFAKAGASHLTIHTEASSNLHRSLQMIRKLGCKVGVAINPGTPAEAVKPVLSIVDLVLVMTVNPGYSGQAFIPETLPKIKQIRSWLDEINPEADIQVDGGVSEETIPLLLQAGANVFVSGNSIFKHPQGIQAGIESLKNKLA